MAFPWLSLSSFVVFLALTVPLFLTPSPIDPIYYHPPKAPALQGAYAPSEKLPTATKLFKGHVDGPEDIISDADGNFYCSNTGGEIKKLLANGTVSVWARTGGRPLGIEWVRQGKTMVVCNAYKGLLLAHSDGTVEVLSTGSNGVSFRLADNADVSSSGAIFFSDASSKFSLPHFLFDAMEARPHGRLLRYNPVDKTTETLIDNLYFANGVALAEDESFVLVAETTRFRVRRYYLQGPLAGTSDIFIDNLPGYPDNINRGTNGLFWIALFVPRQPLMDILHRAPLLSALLVRLPLWMWAHIRHAGLVLTLSPSGEVVHFFSDMSGKHMRMVTSAREYGKSLVLGTLRGDAIFVMKLP